MACSTPPHSYQIQTTIGQPHNIFFIDLILFPIASSPPYCLLFAMLQCSSLAPVDGEERPVNLLQREQDNPSICTLCKEFCEY